MNRSVLRLTLVFILRSVALSGQTSAPAEDKNWAEVCAQATGKTLTIPTFAPVLVQSTLAACDSTELYYGFTRREDPAAALQCAFYERAHPRPAIGDPFYGPGVLTMIYANGRRVPRNLDLAIRFACENTWAAPAEMELRVGHLESLRNRNAPGHNFDLCDDATSGLMQGACESIQQRFADSKRREQLDAVAASWSPPVKTALAILQKRQAAFVQARTRNEVDLSGTGRAAFALEEKGRLADQFRRDLLTFGQGEKASIDPEGYETVNRKLNTTYRKLMSFPESSWNNNTIKPAGIRETERVWLKLRDAWTDFARLAYPQLNTEIVLTHLTALRLKQLQKLQPN